MTAVVDRTVDTPAADVAAAPALASWRARAAAFAIDVLLGVAVLATLVLVAWTAPLRSWLWWVFVAAAVVVFAVMAVNRWLLPTTRGFSLGRAVAGIAVTTRDGAPAGVWRLMLRDLAHVLDTAALLLGWLWPLWDKRRRTFADLLLRTEVRTVAAPERDVRRLTAWVMVGAVAVCAAAVGLSYLVEYRHEQAVDEARTQLVEQGPRIVEELLSYNKDTLQQDFSHAQSLTTDGYRPQLVAQQEVVAQAGATSNDYWAVSSALLPNPPVTPDKGAMLLAMQGQRGAQADELKFITATVRVDFEKVDDQWRVAALTVLKKPQMNQAGQ